MRIFSTIFLFFISCGLVAQQKSGKYEVTLRLPEGGLTASEEMEIELRITDTSRIDPVSGPSPVIRAEVHSEIDMPTMPGMPKISEIAHPEGIPGEYGIHPVFVHGGPYRVKLSIKPPTDEAFEVEFPLEVGDAKAGKRRPSPYKLKVSGPQNHLTLQITGPQGVVKDFDEVHERDLHLIAVRNDLKVFEHVHPTLSPDGKFHLQHEWPAGGDYTLFADFAPRGKGGQIISTAYKVKGSKNAPPLAEDFSLKIGELPQTGRTADVTVKFSPELKLEPYLGAFGHLMIVSADGKTLVHSHPVGDPRPGELDFSVRIPRAGKYRAWLEIQSNGRKLASWQDIEAQP